MKVVINGEKTLLQEESGTLAGLLRLPEWKDRRLVVELNGEIVSREEYDNIMLADGDRIELVHFVGGG
ncbi:sulfur carrier protein ThiS [Paenibacillus sp. HN-1]|nr:sulfur carrier protein ThiS [Paenibacillus sp. CGMCC 1.18879]MBY9083006.1 sulfur carrier protein ThiS [Paenibacillus sinensis]